MPTLRLRTRLGAIQTYAMCEPLAAPQRRESPRSNRVAFAAAHVVADPWAKLNPANEFAINWDRTIAFRHYLWDLGLGVAEAMDTAQRGSGLDWPAAKELIRRSLEAARSRPEARIVCGVGTDHLDLSTPISIDDVIRAYEEQIETVEALGGRLVVMASRALARIACRPDDYARVYDRILSQAQEPVILHWLGEMFDPALAGYWGSYEYPQAIETFLAIVAEHANKIDGVKVSLLSKELEIEMRRRLPANVRMYTGDDYNYAELIAGDNHGHSDALLGVFDPIAPAASLALEELARGNLEQYDAILAPTVPLSRHLFSPPTRFYKTGVVFLSWLNGHQDHFTMLDGQQDARSSLYLCEAFRLADQARVLIDPELAASRMAKHFPKFGLG